MGPLEARWGEEPPLCSGISMSVSCCPSPSLVGSVKTVSLREPSNDLALGLNFLLVFFFFLQLA